MDMGIPQKGAAAHYPPRGLDSRYLRAADRQGDAIYNGASDWADGDGGNDYLGLGAGNDIAFGGFGSDTIVAGSENDRVFGDNGLGGDANLEAAWQGDDFPDLGLVHLAVDGQSSDDGEIAINAEEDESGAGASATSYALAKPAFGALNGLRSASSTAFWARGAR
jgi:Ca2+-binding RTX toxin-like protein